jgi:Concanavalin A-like lectin/glucanases superfamily
VTVDRDNPTGGTFWVDGVAIGTFDPTPHFVSLDNTAPFRIGSRSSSLSGIFNGDIDEVEVFQRVLSASEINQLYQAGIAGKCK